MIPPSSGSLRYKSSSNSNNTFDTQSSKDSSSKVSYEKNNEINNGCANLYLNNRTMCYKIGKNTLSFTSYVRHLGIPLFYSSFDVYSFFISLMTNDTFYNTVLENNCLKSIWEQLWNPDQYEDMMEDFELFRGKGIYTYQNNVDFLSKYFLRCDALTITRESVFEL